MQGGFATAPTTTHAPTEGFRSTHNDTLNLAPGACDRCYRLGAQDELAQSLAPPKYETSSLLHSFLATPLAEVPLPNSTHR